MKHWESKENRATIAEVYKSSEGSPLTTSDSVSLVKTFKTTSDDANYASASGTADAECGNRSVGVRAGGLLQQVRKLFERRYELRSRRNVARLLYTETRKRLDKYESILAKKIPRTVERFLCRASFFFFFYIVISLHLKIVGRI